MLLQALQDYIIPLVNPSEGRDKHTTVQITVRPEAEKLLTALDEFILSVMTRSQLLTALDEFISSVMTRSQSGHQNDISPSSKNQTAVEINELGSAGVIDLPDRTHQGEESENHARLFAKLRERVHNTMPIRLLHSVPDGEKLNISLIDRNTVYSLLAAKMQRKYSEEKFLAKFSLSKRSMEDFIDSYVAQYTGYAILSHTWLRTEGGEVTYNDWLKGAFDLKGPGYQKLVNFCKVARNTHELSLGWMDTVCINKESSSELDESIRSMYKWYKGSTICITYLDATSELSEVHKDPWFTRGWTFQELLAPQKTKFYNTDWRPLENTPNDVRPSNNKTPTEILAQIQQATTITPSEMFNPTRFMNISRKMQLAARRQVMREEDGAYSLMGICDVSISIAYGEGAERAFSRLMTAILTSVSNGALDVFNCAQTANSIIPNTPTAYLQRQDDVPTMHTPIEPLLLTHVGLRMTILLVPAWEKGASDFASEFDPIGNYYGCATFNTSRRGKGQAQYFHLLDKALTLSIRRVDSFNWTLREFGSDKDPRPSLNNPRDIFGVLNISGGENTVWIPRKCLAVCLVAPLGIEWGSTSMLIKKQPTDKPIVFSLRDKRLKENADFRVKKNELAKHGMRLATMYL